MVETVTGLRVVFFGTPAFAVPSLARLLASRHTIVAVVTQPDRPSGRGHHVREGPAKRLAQEHGLPILQPNRLEESAFLGQLASLRADLGVVAAYGKILPVDVLDATRVGMINVHGSLLPAYRGAAPVQRAILAGEDETGVTIMKVVRELDSGPMFGAVRRRIDSNETSVDVETDLARLGADLLLDVIDGIAGGRASPVDQDARLATYAPRLTKADGAIDWHRPAATIHNQVRGLHPWPHASTLLGNDRLILLKTTPDTEQSSTSAPPGTIVEAHGDRFVAAAGDGSRLRILDLQLEGRRPMCVRDFLAGHAVRYGSVFSSSSHTAASKARP